MTTAPPLDLRGLWVPVVTPFDAHGALDLDALERLAHRLLDDGATGLVALGTTGESATLTPVERRLVVQICDRVCRAAGRGLVVGTASASTAFAIDEIEHLTAGTAAVAALAMVPPYTRPTEDAVVAHYCAVADASPVPVIAYHVPYRTGRPLSATTLLPIVTAGFAEPNPAAWKGALARRGELAADRLRPPMTSASAATVDRLLALAAEVEAEADRRLVPT